MFVGSAVIVGCQPYATIARVAERVGARKRGREAEKR
jgi:hypothetical protein